jgi:hypothetical protein
MNSKNAIVNPETGEIILYQPDSAVQLEVRMDFETVWLTQAQMVALFEATKKNVSLHINNIYDYRIAHLKKNNYATNVSVFVYKGSQ